MIGWLAWFATVAGAADLSEEAVAQAIDDIDRLYLHRDEVDPAALLVAAADGLADDVPWLVAVPDRGGVRLMHGNGKELGRVVSGGEIRGLVGELRQVEALVRSANAPLSVDVRYELLDGLTRGLDKFSRLLTGEKLDKFDVRLKGTLVGIGATLRQDGDRLKVIVVAPGGPAERGGLRVGDVLMRIDGVSTVSMPVEEASGRIQGELDSELTVQVRRGSELLDLTFTRAEVVVPNVDHRVLAEGVGYVHIDHFSQRTLENLDAALAALAEDGALARGLVLDLRGNSGGSMKEAARVPDRFLERGQILRTIGADGAKVASLQSNFDAADDGDEIAAPLVVVVDANSASASEILAGALVQLDRAIVVGARTYGKGTVQRIYNLDGDARLKLTVAEYRLAGDRRIAGIGLAPDLGVGRVEAAGKYVRIRDPDDVGVPWDQILPVVVDKGAGSFADQTLDLARRVVLHAQGADRAALLEAAEIVGAQVRAEQEARLEALFRAHDVDWTAPPVDPMAAAPVIEPRVNVHLVSTSSTRPGATMVRVEVQNQGATPLHRASIVLACPTLELWDGLVVPVGRIAPGATGFGEVEVVPQPDLTAREDVVTATLHADDARPTPIGDEVLFVGAAPPPRLTAAVRLLGTGTERRVEVVVKNPEVTAVGPVEVAFAFPDGGVELVEPSQKLASVPARGEARAELVVRLTADAPATVPLTLTLKPGDRAAQSLPVAVPRDGAVVVADPPRINVRNATTAAAAGPWTLDVGVADDRGVTSVEVFLDGHKVAWSPGGRRSVDLKPVVTLAPGPNRVVIVAKDDQGATTRRAVQVRGEADPAAADGR